MITFVEAIVITGLLSVRLYANPSTDIRRWRIDFKISELVVGELTRWRNDRKYICSCKRITSDIFSLWPYSKTLSIL